MTIARGNDPQAFRDFLNRKLADGTEGITLEELLVLWEYENSDEEDREDAVRSIQNGLDDMHAGRTIDAFAFVEEMRRRLSATALG